MLGTPAFVDCSGMDVLMLDNYVKWNEVKQSINYLGIDLSEGLTNYLYYPKKIHDIIESTGWLILVEEIEYQIEKEGFAEPIKAKSTKKKCRRHKIEHK